jgi:hypothetical protein
MGEGVMGNYSKTLSKRLRSGKNDSFAKNDSLHAPDFNFQKVCFKDTYSSEEWWRIQQTHGEPKHNADVMYDLYCSMEHWFSADYWVILDKKCQTAIHTTFQGNPLWHLTITRLDEAPCRDWQIFQAIKNEIVGPQYEAVEMYPAHSRLMDVTNKYHLWILARKDDQQTPPRFPFGCRQCGRILAVGHKPKVLIVGENVLEEHVEEIRCLVDSHPGEVRIFPEALRAEVEKEFPGMEYVKAMYRYCLTHPELDLQVFQP